MQESLCLRTVCSLMVSMLCVLQVLRYFDYVFTGVFTFEMVIKVRATRVHLDSGAGGGHPSAPLGQCLPQGCHLLANDRSSVRPLLTPPLASDPGEVCRGRT